MGSEMDRLLAEYHHTLAAALVPLRQLLVLAEQQRSCAGARDFDRLSAASDERDRVMADLARLDRQLSCLRPHLEAHRTQAATLDLYRAIVDLGQEAGRLITQVGATDAESLKTLSDAERARRAAMASLEQGETTLAAYRKVLATPGEHAAMVDRVG